MSEQGSDIGDGSDLPPEAAGRLGSSTFSSGLSVPDFAACLDMGLRPVGLVQGFCVMQWSWYASSAYYGSYGSALSSYGCPHYGYNIGAEHRVQGYNYEQRAATQAWRTGYTTARRRMLEEAQDAGAHGVVGVVDRTSHLIDGGVYEFHMLGTAVVVEDAAAGPGVWSTYLAGQRLGKLIEAGFMPVSVTATRTTIVVSEVCTTHTLLRGMPDPMGYANPGDEITQMSDAHMAARRLARDRIRSELGSDALHGASMEATEHEISEGYHEVSCSLRGTRVHQFKAADPLPVPVPTVSLA